MYFQRNISRTAVMQEVERYTEATVVADVSETFSRYFCSLTNHVTFEPLPLPFPFTCFSPQWTQTR